MSTRLATARAIPAAMSALATIACVSSPDEYQLRDPGELVYSSACVERFAQIAAQDVESDPTSADARHRLGSILLDEGYIPEAIAQLETGLASGERPVEFRLQLARALRRRSWRDLRRATGLLAEARQLAPGNRSVRLELGYTYAQQGLKRRAIALLEPLIAESPEPLQRLSLHLVLLALYDGLGDANRADWHLQEARQIDLRSNLDRAKEELTEEAFPVRWAFIPERGRYEDHEPLDVRMGRVGQRLGGTECGPK